MLAVIAFRPCDVSEVEKIMLVGLAYGHRHDLLAAMRVFARPESPRALISELALMLCRFFRRARRAGGGGFHCKAGARRGRAKARPLAVPLLVTPLVVGISFSVERMKQG